MNVLTIILFLTSIIFVYLYVTRRTEEKTVYLYKTNNTMAYSPTTIANYFISNHSKDGDLTAMKLLKLSYIAYGWYLALTDNKEKLINEKPVAWDLGPVFPSLYGNIKKYYKEFKIKELIPNNSDETISQKDKTFLDKIWSMYGKYDGVYLSALTHENGTPWKDVYCQGCNSILDDSSIYQHYKSRLEPING